MRITKCICSLAALSVLSVPAFAKTELVVWEDVTRSDSVTSFVEEFEKQNDCKVTVKEVMMQRQLNELIKYGPQGQGPDILTLAADIVGNAYTKDLIVPISFMQFDAPLYLPNSVASVSFNGEIYAVPKTIENLILFYNKDLIKDPPQSLIEYIQMSKDLKKEGKYALLARWDEFYTTFGLIYGYGGYIFKTELDGSLDFTHTGLYNEGAVKAMKLLRSMYNDGMIIDYDKNSDGYTVMYKLFSQGKALAVINGPWAIEDYRKAGVNFGVSTLPVLPNGSPMSSFLGTKGYAISKFSRNQELAEKFLRYLNEHDNAIKRYEITSQIPPILSVLGDENLATDELVQVIAEQSSRSVNMPSSPVMYHVWKAMDKAISDVEHTNENIQTILTKAGKFIEKQAVLSLENEVSNAHRK
ncbi:MAG: extracellular solute-binding protein [Succinivibrio sp.]